MKNLITATAFDLAEVHERRAPSLRSLLFIPANNGKFVEKATQTFADAIVLDLEDAILADCKADARRAVKGFAKELKASGHFVIVRINSPIGQAVLDIEASVCEDVDAIMVPKVKNATHLDLLEECVYSFERAIVLSHKIHFITLVETPEAVHNIREIAAHKRVVAIAFGDEDLAFELGCTPSSGTLTALKTSLIVAAAEHDCVPIGLVGTISEFRNLDEFKVGAEKAYDLGFKGTLCIHPTQVDVANQVFKPSQAQVDHAQQVIESYQEAKRNGKAVANLGGKMIDLPVIRQAQAILQLSETTKS